ncbi:hypothetical protein [Aquitalea pelogenes]|uniref:hypothetical protein n=1 Tax=Aquitalea pelogenes TaxID=1293573 RepID=UPI0035B325A5
MVSFEDKINNKKSQLVAIGDKNLYFFLEKNYQSLVSELKPITRSSKTSFYKLVCEMLHEEGFSNATVNMVSVYMSAIKRKTLSPSTVITRMDDITSHIDTTHKGDSSPVQPGGDDVPGSAVTPMPDKVVKAPVVQEKSQGVGLVVSSPESSERGVSREWWDDVAQSLGVEIKQVPSGFNWNGVDANLSYQKDREYLKEYSDNELLLFGHVLYNARKNKLPMKKIFKATDFIIKEQGNIAFELMTKAISIKTININ